LWDVVAMHGTICENTQTYGGYFRQCDLFNLTALNIDPPHTWEIEDIMTRLMWRFNNLDKPLLYRAVDLHYDLTAAQAFNDCNKRLARICMNWALYRTGFTPIVFNHKHDRENYMAAIAAKNDGTENERYYEFMFSAMIATQCEIKKLLIRRKVR
jgi:Fic family protein